MCNQLRLVASQDYREVIYIIIGSVLALLSGLFINWVAKRVEDKRICKISSKIIYTELNVTLEHLNTLKQTPTVIPMYKFLRDDYLFDAAKDLLVNKKTRFYYEEIIKLLRSLQLLDDIAYGFHDLKDITRKDRQGYLFSAILKDIDITLMQTALNVLQLFSK